MAQHDHEMLVRGISLQKPSVRDSARPQCEYELENRVAHPPTMLSNIEDFAIFPNIGNSLGEVCGGARVWQESCAWGRDKIFLGHLE